jgi:hypothetical protein
MKHLTIESMRGESLTEFELRLVFGIFLVELSGMVNLLSMICYGLKEEGRVITRARIYVL